MNKRIFSEEDFEKLSWHDNFIHAMSFDPDEHLFYLDIDYLAEWNSPNDAGHFSFTIAPSTLIYTDVYDLKIDVEVSSIVTFDIRNVSREPYKTKYSADQVFYKYIIELDYIGKITFLSSGFKLYLREIYRDMYSQCLTKKERGGISYETDIKT
jgi:hypothetical protein